MSILNILKSVLCIGFGFVICSRSHAAVEWDSNDLKPTESIGAAMVEFAFSFKNTGKLPVEFEAPSASCGCTLTKWDKTVYAPGESGSLNGTYNTSGKRGVNSVTIMVKGAEVDGEMRRPFSETLRLSVTIPEVVKISPGITLWRKDSEVIAKTIRFEVNPSYPLSLTLTKIGKETFTGEWIAVEVGKVYELMVAPLSTGEADQAVVTVEGVNKDGKLLRFHAHLMVR